MTTFTHSKKKESLFSDYCQFLLASITNWTQTYFADHNRGGREFSRIRSW